MFFPHCWKLHDRPFAVGRQFGAAIESSEHGFRHALGQLSAACDKMGMKTSTKKTEKCLS